MAYRLTNIIVDIEKRVACYEQAIRETGAPLWIGDSVEPHIEGRPALWADEWGDYSKFWAAVRRIEKEQTMSDKIVYTIKGEITFTDEEFRDKAKTVNVIASHLADVMDDLVNRSDKMREQRHGPVELPETLKALSAAVDEAGKIVSDPDVTLKALNEAKASVGRAARVATRDPLTTQEQIDEQHDRFVAMLPPGVDPAYSPLPAEMPMGLVDILERILR